MDLITMIIGCIVVVVLYDVLDRRDAITNAINSVLPKKSPKLFFFAVTLALVAVVDVTITPVNEFLADTIFVVVLGFYTGYISKMRKINK